MNADRLLALCGRVADSPDAIARLRRFVLALAVRGKLVEQDPADEPAAELLKRIEAEKARLVKARKIRRVKVASINSKEIPFIIPECWQWTRLGNVGDWGAGSTPLRGNPEFFGNDFVWLKSGELNDDLQLSYSEERVTQLAVTKNSFRINQPGDVLIAMYGATIGKLAILAETAVTNQAVCGCTTFRGVYNLFLFYFLLSKREEFHASSEGGAQPNISKVKIVSTLFPLPPLAEQHRIVSKVDELMALCDRLEEARTAREDTRDRLTKASLARLSAPDADDVTFRSHTCIALDALPALSARADQVRHLRQTILNLAVRGKLVEQDSTDEPVPTVLAQDGKATSDTSLFDVPSSWAWVHVETVAKTRLGKMLDKVKNRGKPRKYLRNINVRWCDFDLSDVLRMRFEDAELSEFSLQHGDVLICEGGEPGRAAVWDERVDDIYFQKALHRVRFSDIVDSQYFVNALRASADDGRLAEYFTGTGIKHFTGKELRAYAFPLPPIAEQHRVVAKVDELMALCDELETALAAADTTRSNLLQAILGDTLASTGNA